MKPVCIRCILHALILTLIIHLCVTNAAENQGKVNVNLCLGEPAVFSKQDHPRMDLYLLTDEDDIMGHIQSLQEQSKPELEPLIKQYMYAAEALTGLASKRENFQDQDIQQKKEHFRSLFRTTEKRIATVLARYKTLIDALIHRHTLYVLQDMPVYSQQLQFRNLSPGTYRVYGVLTFSTTNVTWFEPITVKGGGCHILNLTRENIMNPYWTELNWWSFMNLDFSKHH